MKLWWEFLHICVSILVLFKLLYFYEFALRVQVRVQLLGRWVVIYEFKR